jgi:DNA-binding NarL/FixJ family response regulator
MVKCRRILELYFEGVSQRTISSSTGHSRNTVSDVVQRAKKLGVESLNDTMNNPWLETRWTLICFNFKYSKFWTNLL